MLKKSEFATRRKKLLNKLQKDSIAIICSGPEMFRHDDNMYEYRQNSDFYYLTGLNEPDAVAVFISTTKNEFILFNREKNPSKEIWTGNYVGQNGSINDYGANVSYPISKLDEEIPRLLMNKHCIYMSYNDKKLTKLIMKWMTTLQQNTRLGVNIPTEFLNLNEILHEMRLIKSPSEISIMRQAEKITGQAHIKAMQICKPGMMEYQLQASIEYDFKNNGMMGPAYGTIVGSGKNACILHYIDNNNVLRDGDLVLIDAGCENDYYAVDITRTFPVNGKFSKEQRVIYELVLQTQKSVINLIKPGITYDKLQSYAKFLITEGLIKLRILKGNINKLLEDKAYLSFYMHDIGHWLGMDVHDVGSYKNEKNWRKLEPGMVISIEPGIYIRHDNKNVDVKWRGIGVRIEDNILVTKTGNDVLSKGIPKTIEEIESIQKKNKN
jgi:Xaa-Pro aminopeptidase